MNNGIKTFVNHRYMSMNLVDLILKMLSYFAYSYIMVIPTTLQIFDVQKYGFSQASFFDDRIIPLLILATVLSGIMAIISVFIYHYKTKWSVILIRGLTFFYISITSLMLSCFAGFELNVLNLCYMLIKIVIYCICYFIYIKYLFKKKLPNIENIVHGRESTSVAIFIASTLTVMIRPLVTFLSKSNFEFSFNGVVSATEYIISVGIIVNIVDAVIKTYYAKIYDIK